MTTPSNKPRIVITGTGVVTPIAIGAEAYWQAALDGRCGLRDITRFDTSNLRAHRGGEVLDFSAEDFVPQNEINTMGRASHLAIASTRMALEAAGLAASANGKGIDYYAPERRGVSFGTTMGEPEVLLDLAAGVAQSGVAGFPTDLTFLIPSSRISNNVARMFQFHGINFQIPTACAAGNYAIGYAADLLRMRRADVVVAGGSDAFSQIAFLGFNKLLACATDTVRPFDKNRGGMMIGEGSGAVVLERLEDAQARGANILAEYLDYGLGCDAFKMTIPHPEGTGGIIAMRQALSRSGVTSEQVDLICGHATGTKENDKVETLVIKEVLGAHAYKIKVNGLKAMLGHTMGAASAIEAVASAMMVARDTILPTINYTEADPDCDLDYVPNTPQQQPLNIVVSNAYAFGGNCSSIVLKKYVATGHADGGVA